jgi:hypothetical protein
MRCSARSFDFITSCFVVELRAVAGFTRKAALMTRRQALRSEVLSEGRRTLAEAERVAVTAGSSKYIYIYYIYIYIGSAKAKTDVLSNFVCSCAALLKLH